MLFGMVEKGMDGEVRGDKGKLRAPNPATSVQEGSKGVEALWAVLLTKELWKKGVWNDSKSVSIVSLGCFHPVAKVQSASLHFFLGEDDDEDESDSEDEGPDIKALQHRREINKKTKSGDRKMAKAEKLAKKVWRLGSSSHKDLLSDYEFDRSEKRMRQLLRQTFRLSSNSMTRKALAKSCMMAYSNMVSSALLLEN
jgi:hypothetical protein